MTMSKSEVASLSIENRVRREQAHFELLADELGNVWWGHIDARRPGPLGPETVRRQANLDHWDD